MIVNPFEDGVGGVVSQIPWDVSRIGHFRTVLIFAQVVGHGVDCGCYRRMTVNMALEPHAIGAPFIFVDGVKEKIKCAKRVKGDCGATHMKGRADRPPRDTKARVILFAANSSSSSCEIIPKD